MTFCRRILRPSRAERKAVARRLMIRGGGPGAAGERQVFITLMLGNLLVWSLAFSAILTATRRAMVL
jgi:hypothetical protein